MQPRLSKEQIRIMADRAEARSQGRLFEHDEKFDSEPNKLIVVARFEDASPPAEAPPVYPRATELGILPFLRAQENTSGNGWRCCECGCFSQNRWLVWVPDGVKRSDTLVEICEACRRSTYNGHFSAWCLNCARKLGFVPGATHRTFTPRPVHQTIASSPIKPPVEPDPVDDGEGRLAAFVLAAVFGLAAAIFLTSVIGR